MNQYAIAKAFGCYNAVRVTCVVARLLLNPLINFEVGTRNNMACRCSGVRVQQPHIILRSGHSASPKHASLRSMDGIHSKAISLPAGSNPVLERAVTEEDLALPLPPVCTLMPAYLDVHSSVVAIIHRGCLMNNFEAPVAESQGTILMSSRNDGQFRQHSAREVFIPTPASCQACFGAPRRS
jgi:hypothetical protein